MVLKRFLLVLVALAALPFAMPWAHAQDVAACDAARSSDRASDRVALVIGNSGYRPGMWPHLDNADHDADAVCAAFAAQGFRVILLRDGTRAGMAQAISAFGAAARNADTALLYYAGHGFEYAGFNYLVPVDAPRATSRAGLHAQFVDLAGVLEMVKEAKHGLVFLDACRTRDAVVQIEDADADGPDGPPGTINLPNDFEGVVFYSTARGNPAFDAAPADSPNSPFARAVVSWLDTPDLELMRYFAFVRSDVKRVTQRPGPAQVPITYGFLSDPFYFRRTPELAFETNEPGAPGSVAAGSRPRRARTGAVRSALPPRAKPGVTREALPSFTRQLASFDPGKAQSALAAIDKDTLAHEDEPQIIGRILAQADQASLAALADSGDPTAGYLYGAMLYLGLGVPKDLDAAREVLSRAADSGQPAAELEYGYFLETYGDRPGDKAAANVLYEKAAASGYGKAEAHLAYRLWNGEGVTMDRPRALALWSKAADEGYPYAIFAIGTYGRRKDEAKAKLGALAAAGNRAGDAWLCELGVWESRPQAMFNHCLAAAQDGYSNAMAITATLYAGGGEIQPSPREAAYWARLALAQADFTDADRRAAAQRIAGVK